MYEYARNGIERNDDWHTYLGGVYGPGRARDTASHEYEAI